MTPAQSSRAWSAVILPFAVFGMFAPYLSRAAGLPVPVAPNVEIVDHVIPGLVVLGSAAGALLLGRLHLVAALMATLAGFWMTATHVPLLLQAGRDEVGWSPALIHSTGGILVLLVAIAGAVVAWREDAAAQ